MNRFSQILAALSETEAEAVYNALAQWADNERNGLEEAAPETDQEKRTHGGQELAVGLVEGVVARLETELVR